MLKAEHVAKSYPGPVGTVEVLRDVNLTVDRGEPVAIMGPSGSGKSTLLYILGALDTPTAGSVTLDNAPYAARDEAQQAAFRNAHVGFVFQDHALLPQCTALENVLVPALVAPEKDDYESRGVGLLSTVGLSERMHHRPAQLSGGEKQRVAIARALIRQPALMLCDEPTGNLDAASARSIADLLLDIARDRMLVVVTHSAELAARFPARYQLVEGELRRA
jgi:lipoprotein-releasing system ATP-binding protein